MTQLLETIAITGVLWFIMTLVCPRVKIVDNMPPHITASNTAALIKIRSDIHNWTGVFAQEYYESKFKHNPINLIRLLFKDDSLEREMELMGHEITVQFLPEEDQELGRWQHATNLHTYYKCFHEWDVSTIYGLLQDQTPYAQEWIKDNIEKITKLEGKYRE